MLCAEGRIASTEDENGDKEEKAEQCMAEEKRLEKKINRKCDNCGGWSCSKRMHRQCCHNCVKLVGRAGGLRRLKRI